MSAGDTWSEAPARFFEGATQPAPQAESPEDLLQQCADMDDTEAWETFLVRFNPLIEATVVSIIRRYGSDGAGLRDDLVQEVYAKLCANRAKVLRDFEPRYPGAVFGFVRVIAANVVHDYFKSRQGQVPGVDATPLPDNLAAPDEERDGCCLIRDIDDVFRQASVSARDRQIVWLYYRHGMSAKEIAAIASLKLTTKGVESVIVRLKDLIRKAFGRRRQ